MVRKQGLWGFTMKNNHNHCNLHTKVEIIFFYKTEKKNFGP